MNSTTRIGKIARLAHSIREQLNLRLHDHQPHKVILPWLNSLPEVKAILAADFDNRPITKQNLSEWKQGGFRDWLLLYHASHFLCDADIPVGDDSQGNEAESGPSNASDDPTTRRVVPLSSTGGEGRGEEGHNVCNDLTRHATRTTGHASRLTAKLLLWTQLQYTTMARHIDAETDPDRKWTALRQFANDISRLRRSTLADDFLQIQRDWLALSQSNSSEKKELEFCKWIKRPDIADAIKNKKRVITREEWRKIEEEDLYLLGPDNPSLDEHIAQVRLAKELMARRKAKEAEAKRQPGDPAPELPAIKLRDTTFEELFPTIPDKPLSELDLDNPNCGEPESSGSPSLEEVGRGVPTAPQQETAPNPADIPSNPSDKSYKSDQSDSFPPAPHSPSGDGQSNPVQPGPTESNQIQPGPPLDPEPNPNHDSPF